MQRAEGSAAPMSLESGRWSIISFRRLTVALTAPITLGGCHEGILDPQGPVGAAEKTILLNSLGIMLAIVIPTILATLGVAWWYRASNVRAKYLPDWEYSGRLELIIWSIPVMVVLLLGGIGWVGSHDLDPPKPLVSAVAPINVEVVSLDWKWLFIYPDQKIATVNRLVVPAGTPISFHLTSASVWNSFFVPQLGTQVYTMAGMATRLNLMADKPGIYPGLSAHYSGDGFSDMRFKVEALPPARFAQWASATRGSGAALDGPAYVALAQPSQAVAPRTYGSVEPGLFATIVKTTAKMPDARSSSPTSAATSGTLNSQGK